MRCKRIIDGMKQGIIIEYIKIVAKKKEEEEKHELLCRFLVVYKYFIQ